MIAPRRLAVGLTIAAGVVGMLWWESRSGAAYGSVALIALLAAAAVRELLVLLEGAGLGGHPRLAVVATAALLVLRGLGRDLGLEPSEARELFLVGLGAACVAPLAVQVASRKPEGELSAVPLRRAMATAFALAYVTLLASFLLELRLLGQPGSIGLRLVFLLLVAVKAGDSCAYFVGRMVGRVPLCWVSPRKTWEGTLASLGAALVLGVLLAGPLGIDPRLAGGFAVVANLAGQGGDLIESYVKRVLGAKDSGRSFGEMGGMLDTMDSLLLAAPAAYVWADLLVMRGPSGSL